MIVYITKDTDVVTGGSSYNFKTSLKKGEADLSPLLIEEINANYPGVIGEEEVVAEAPAVEGVPEVPESSDPVVEETTQEEVVAPVES